MPRVTTNCRICGDEFSYNNTSGHRGLFCSRKCRGVHSKRIGLQPPTYSGDKHPSWTGGRHVWKGSRVPYIRVTVNGKRVFEHRYLMEQKIGRPLRANEVVHHINKDSLDNRLENLRLMGRGEHTVLHHLGQKQNREAA